MTGSWEILLILIAIAAFLGPRLAKRSKARKHAVRKPIARRTRAKEVEYEIDEDA